ncbi:MAG: exodeoxyribonuclease V subunit gamma [Bacteroidota bacterium]|nr:exodeoxyribonuclease V subunit gamma [Bacteroidota bacterium]MDP4232377.1 exodeoxyribonuclease V subunit gamma [Bacteroidota bacterium]MDP4241514.1 exodeoxyribonuclease V subunit gamma [Bacteroidota bacterium]MDP4288248.1 exodeoxyribonuclease V subunit gamma [Bacteroidota bacterium]
MPLLVRPPSPLRFRSIEDEVKRLAREGRSEEFLLIVPNRIAQRRMERELVAAAEGRAIAKPNVLTLADFAGELCRMAFPTLYLLSDAESAVLIEQSIRELLQKRELTYFERATADDSPGEHAFPIPRGTFELVVNTIRELKENGITVDDIGRELKISRSTRGDTTESRRAADIQAVYRAYHTKLEMRFMDTYGQTLLLNERYLLDDASIAQSDFRACFPHVLKIFIDGFYHLEAPALQLLSAFDSTSDLLTIISLDFDEENVSLFGGVIELQSRLEAMGFSAREASKSNSNEIIGKGQSGIATYADVRALLRRHLFTNLDEAFEPIASPQIKYFEAANPLAEMDEIAKQIKLIWEHDTEVRSDLSRIVVAMPVIEDYALIAREVFRRCGIPVEIADRERLDRAPLFLALLSLFDLVRPTPHVRQVRRALGSPYFDFRRSPDKSIDSQNLLTVLLHDRPTGDLAGWLRSLAAREDSIRASIEASSDSDEAERLTFEADRLAAARLDLSHLRALLVPFTTVLKPKAFVQTLRNLFENLGVRERLLASSRETIGIGHLERDTRAYRAIIQVTEELESLFRLLELQNQPHTVAFYVERLKAASIFHRFSGRARAGVVHITPLTQAVATPADYLFVAGLAEGALPRAYQPQVFLMDSHQRGEQKQLREDRVLFYQALTHARKQLILSVPQRTLAGGELSRSMFLDVLSEVVKWHELPKAIGAFSWHDLHESAGKLAAVDPNWLERLERGVDEINAITESVSVLRDRVPRILAMEQQRAKFADTIYRGHLDLAELTPDERKSLDDNRSRIWSVTQLELYAGCPFKYFAERVLTLGHDEEREDGLDARERGSALHEILRDFLTTRRDQMRQWIQDLPEHEMESAYTDLQEAAERHFASLASRHPSHSEHPFWRLDRERLLSDTGPTENVLRRFVRRERELAPYEQRPRFFEVSFGSSMNRTSTGPCDPTLSCDEPVTVGGIRLRGRIDRIDQSDDSFSIIDYKSGKEIPPFRSIERGLSLQLPLYLRVAEDLLRSHVPELQGVAALYYHLMDPESKRAPGLAVREFMERSFENLGQRNRGILDSPEDLEAMIEQTIAKAQGYVEGIAAGNFRLVSQDLMKSQCPNCSYAAVCRVREADELGVLTN